VRLLSLVPSGTEILHALGLGEYQVGRSHECDFPSSVVALPVCTKPLFDTTLDSSALDRRVKECLSAAASIYEINTEAIKKLRPSHVVTQTLCKVCAVSQEDVEAVFNSQTSADARIVGLDAYSLQTIWSDILRVAAACDCSEVGHELVGSLQLRMNRISQLTHTAKRRPRVAAIEWIEPLMSAGNWIPELLDMANADSVLASAGVHSPYIEWTELVSSDPDVIVLMPCGFNVARTCSEMRWLVTRSEWKSLRAVQFGEVYICDGNQYMNRPGPRISESLQIFAEILHPDQFEPSLAGAGWERFSS
jgi:iron complex transport system substrate-binding protein